MLRVVGGSKAAEAEQTAHEGGRGRNRTVDGGPLHEGTDDAELAAGGIEIGHIYFVQQSFDARNFFPAGTRRSREIFRTMPAPTSRPDLWRRFHEQSIETSQLRITALLCWFKRGH